MCDDAIKYFKFYKSIKLKYELYGLTMEVNMKKILVTGANGYLGQGIVKTLLDMGNIVIASDIDVKYVDNRAIKKACNIFELNDPYNYCEQPDVLLHLAWRDGFVHYSDSHIIDLPKHYAFLKLMAKSNIETISVMGSMHEIGFFEGSIDENTPCRPESFYGIAKNALREITRMYCKQFEKNFQWLRGYYIVGDSSVGSSIFSKICKSAEDGKKTFPFTMGLNQFDFVDYDVFCNQVAVTIMQNEINGIINICSGRPEKLSDRVERFIKEHNFDIKLEYGKFPDRPYDSKAVWGNSTKIEKIMNNYHLNK